MSTETVTVPEAPRSTKSTVPADDVVPVAVVEPEPKYPAVVVADTATDLTGLPKRSTTLAVTTEPTAVAETIRAFVLVVEANVTGTVTATPPAVAVTV